jgi:hypothetical protein
MEEYVKNTLTEAGPVTILLRDEDEKLNVSKLRKSMPPNWSWAQLLR